MTDYTTHRAEALAALNTVSDLGLDTPEVPLTPVERAQVLLDIALVHASLAQAAVASGPAALRRTVDELKGQVDRLVADLARASGQPEAVVRLKLDGVLPAPTDDADSPITYTPPGMPRIDPPDALDAALVAQLKAAWQRLELKPAEAWVVALTRSPSPVTVPLIVQDSHGTPVFTDQAKAQQLAFRMRVNYPACVYVVLHITHTPDAGCTHEDLSCPPGTCDWSGRDGRDG